MKRSRLLLVILYPALLAATAALSLLPMPETPPLNFLYLDKIEHGCVYAVLGILGALFFQKPGDVRRLAPAGKSLAAGLVLGTALELIQPWIGRSGEAADGLANTAGLLVGTGIFLLLSKQKRGGNPGQPKG